MRAGPVVSIWRPAVASLLVWWVALVGLFCLSFWVPPWRVTSSRVVTSWTALATCAALALLAQWAICRRWELARRSLMAIGFAVPLLVLLVVLYHWPVLQYRWLRLNASMDLLVLPASMLLALVGIAVVCATAPRKGGVR